MCPDAPYFIILLCLTPDGFTRQERSAAPLWVDQTICQCILLANKRQLRYITLKYIQVGLKKIENCGSFFAT